MPVGSKQLLKHGHCNMSASLVQLLQTYLLGVRHVCWSIMVNMSADPVAMVLGQLVGRKKKRYAHWPDVA